MRRKALTKVMAFAGFRLGEVLAMRREHLYESRQTYYVAQGCKRGLYGRPKSGKMRLMDLPGFLMVDVSGLDVTARPLVAVT